MSRDVRYDPDSERYLDYPLPGRTPPPGWIEKMEADIAALPIAMMFEGEILCPTCAARIAPAAHVVEEDGTFGVRECEECGQEVRAE